MEEHTYLRVQQDLLDSCLEIVKYMGEFADEIPLKSQVIPIDVLKDLFLKRYYNIIRLDPSVDNIYKQTVSMYKIFLSNFSLDGNRNSKCFRNLKSSFFNFCKIYKLLIRL